jgi:hypothetical protein
MVAMVEGAGVDSNGFSMLKVGRDGTIEVSGFQKQSSYNWLPK